MSWINKLLSHLPKPDGWSLSFPPAINFPFKKESPMEKFERLLVEARWGKNFINDNEVWICDEDALFQIDISADSTEFAEPWTARFPDKTASKQPVKLMIGSTVIRELYFIWCDGGRYLLPIPKIKGLDKDQKQIFRWSKKGLYFKVENIIGRYHSFKDFDEVAGLCQIVIEDNV